MKKEEKQKQVAWLQDQFQGVKAVFLMDFQGLTVSEMNTLRSEVRTRGGALKVMKNTLVRLAYKGTDVECLGPDLVGPRAAVWTHSEETAPALAKTLVDFAKTHPKLGLVKGELKGRLVEATDLETLAKLPSREELLSRLLGTLVAPISAFVGTLAAVPRSFLTVLKAIEDKKGESAPAEG
ncbi:MAG: 50S ribosomal protein L10 [Deltaproteobacteria bacterium]|nr:50S ribosomal protein L10 [Deltaproteobacteria bacterium]